TTKLAELSLSGAPPIVSPDGKLYLSASFSNFEVEFGWHVYLNTVGSSSKKEIFSTPESLTSVAFSADGGKIAFVVSKGKGGSQITVVDLKTQKNREIYTTNAEILSLAWDGSTIFFVEAPAKKSQANQAELYQISDSGKDKKRLTTNDRAENFVAAAADGSKVAFLDLSYSSGNVTPETTGTVSVLNLASGKIQTYGEAVQVAGFESTSE
ncbi:PD40 domain-containing protein, partial [Candidatus Berkelbacteria bacterium]|nr:PD40 domain-containing protein [Candidatus Berkelbacteria bacterium]